MLFFGFFCTILNAKDEKGSFLHALIWSQTTSCPKITKKEKAEFVVVRISKEGHRSSNKGRRGSLFIVDYRCLLRVPQK